MPWRLGVPDISEGLAKGISNAGSSISDAITKIGENKQRNDNANQSLDFLHEIGALHPEEYANLSDKATRVKEEFIGKFAGRYFNNEDNLKTYKNKYQELQAMHDFDTNNGIKPKGQANLDEVSINNPDKIPDDQLDAELERRGLKKKAPAATPALTMDSGQNLNQPGFNLRSGV